MLPQFVTKHKRRNEPIVFAYISGNADNMLFVVSDQVCNTPAVCLPSHSPTHHITISCLFGICIFVRVWRNIMGI